MKNLTNLVVDVRAGNLLKKFDFSKKIFESNYQAFP
jgi:hypothetical protein